MMTKGRLRGFFGSRSIPIHELGTSKEIEPEKDGKVLPFEGRPEKLGDKNGGTYVNKVVVSRKALKYKNGTTNRGNEQMAIKVFPPEYHPSFHKERLNLILLKGSSVPPESIQLCFGTVLANSRGYIISELATCDLRHILVGEYIFTSPRVPPMLLLNEAHSIANGLEWLHRDLVGDGGQLMTGIHMDLKPTNILVF
ncbi:uncharacterized protein K452DRAFT_52976 [Aplosporella prunicola CBS 121167]|uniref:Protein kinase domain-containing protein n=1 Tax=Aplosporella prunicola CBS 121167 TaxID=1176127 RepID=A0A6A6B9H6_9PEZI|nr:uncharacterized protein K452DRAFT_52976 [Aplosporella prunicola CBS 121167]KAF2140218.1 hypothetical protein K452DRAFT_52976 [Aplosporella prunicola CBS 121167]